jgi:Ca-activated chloride channel family protein
MSFLAPAHLWLLVAVLVAALAVWRLEVARGRALARFVTPELAPSFTARRPGWRRLVQAGGLLATFVALVLASARPARSVEVRVNTATIMVALDASTSMGAHDVAPSRVVAAQRAAAAFIRALPRDFRVGLIQFASAAVVEVAPGDDRSLALDALRRVKVADGTAIGEAIFSALDTLTQDAGKVSTGPAAAPKYPRLPFSAIVVLSDGGSNTGRPVPMAIAAAHTAAVPVSGIAFGTKQGTIGPARDPVPVSEETLQSIAAGTGGHFFRATSGPDLRAVFVDLGAQLAHNEKHHEITRWFTGAAIALGLFTGLYSSRQFARMP